MILEKSITLVNMFTPDSPQSYTWIKFADDSNGNGISDNPEGKIYVGLAYNKNTQFESNNPSAYTWDNLQDSNGSIRVVDKNGNVHYTWIMFADNSDGDGMTTDPTGKEYIGLAFDKEVSEPSTSPYDYKWSTYRGVSIGALNGTNGVTYYTWIMYADDVTGAGISSNPLGKKYVGFAYNKTTRYPSLNPADYTWSKYVGETPTTISILSSNGSVFKNGQGSTKLIARLYKGEVEVDASGTEYEYTWSKKDNGITSSWSATGKEIEVNQNHVEGITVFTVEIEGVGQGQFTIADLNDIIVSMEAPENPITGTLWYNMEDGLTYIWNGNKWVATVVSDVVGGANKIRNSRFKESKYWNMSECVTIDTEIKSPNGYSTIKIDPLNHSYEIDDETWCGITTDTRVYKMNCHAGQNVSAHVKAYVPQDGDSREAKIILKFYNASDIELGYIEQEVDTQLKGIWQHLKIDGLTAPNNTSYITFGAYARKGTCWFGEPMVEFGSVCTDFRPSTEDVQDEAEDLVNRVVNIEQYIDDDTIISTVLGSEEAKILFGDKAGVKDLEGLVSGDDLEVLLKEQEKLMDDKIGGIDMGSYIKRTDFEQSMSDFLFQFKQGGGCNLIRDSIGFANTHEWWIMENVIPIQGNPQMTELGFPSGWLFQGLKNAEIPDNRAIVGQAIVGACASYSENYHGGGTTGGGTTGGGTSGGGSTGGGTSGGGSTGGSPDEYDVMLGSVDGSRVNYSEVGNGTNARSMSGIASVRGVNSTAELIDYMIIDNSKIGNCIIYIPREIGGNMGTGGGIGTGSGISRLTQRVKLNANKKYTMGFYISKSINTGAFNVYVKNPADNTTVLASMVLPSTSEYSMDYVFWTFTPNISEIDIVFESSSTSPVFMTGLMLAQGGLPLNWQAHPQELYNSNVKFDINGITVNRMDDNGTKVGYTSISPTEFAGYYTDPVTGKMTKVFWLEKDSTYTKKVIAKEEINIGTVKIVQVNGGDNVGIAFVGMNKPVE